MSERFPIFGEKSVWWFPVVELPQVRFFTWEMRPPRDYTLQPLQRRLHESTECCSDPGCRWCRVQLPVGPVLNAALV